MSHCYAGHIIILLLYPITLTSFHFLIPHKRYTLMRMNLKKVDVIIIHFSAWWNENNSNNFLLLLLFRYFFFIFWQRYTKIAPLWFFFSLSYLFLPSFQRFFIQFTFHHENTCKTDIVYNEMTCSSHTHTRFSFFFSVSWQTSKRIKSPTTDKFFVYNVHTEIVYHGNPFELGIMM